MNSVLLTMSALLTWALTNPVVATLGTEVARRRPRGVGGFGILGLCCCVVVVLIIVGVVVFMRRRQRPGPPQQH